MQLTPFWPANCSRPDDLQSAPPPDRTDVVVIGAGFTGLNAALTLAKSNTKVTLVEAHTVAYGASGRNGGFLPTHIRVPTPKLIKMYGRERAQELWQTSIDGITLVEKLVAEESIDCHFHRFGQLKLALKPAHMKEMVASAEFHEREFGHKTKVIDQKDLHTEIGSNVFHGAVLDPAVAALHPAKYAYGLASAFKRHGGHLSEKTEVTGVARKADGFEVATNQGNIQAKEVLFATNGYTGPTALPELRSRVFIGASFVIVTEPLSPALQRELAPTERVLVDSKRLLSYFRLTPDGRMLYGGQNRFDPEADVNETGRHLREEMVGVFPQLANVPIEYSWSGRMGLTFDLMPHIGRIEGIHYALGYCGRGVGMASYVGTEVALMMAGKKKTSPFAEIPHKKMFLYRKNAWFLPALGAVYRAFDRLG